jgi:sugar lactone lactonase YvrE
MKKVLAFSIFTLTSSIIALKAQTGTITTIAGTGVANYNGDGRTATTAEVNNPSGVAVDLAGNVYIADQVNNRIRKISTTGQITTVAGNGYRPRGGGGGYSGDGGQATSAELNYPNCVRVDTLGNIYFSDAGNAIIRKVSTTGIITHIVGIPTIGGYSGNGGQATAAELNYPVGIGLDRNLNIYIADQDNNVIRKYTANTRVITTFAGDHNAGFTGNGGAATAARLNSPTGVAVSPSGTVYIADYNNNEIRAVSTAGIISDFAGNGIAGYVGNEGPATASELANPTGVSTDLDGNVYIADAGNAIIWQVVVPSDQMYAIAGINVDGFSGDGGPAVNAELNYPFDVITARNHYVYVADLNNNRIREILAGCNADSTTVAVYTYPSCNGNSDGIAVALSNSIFQPYVYSWNTGSTNQEVTGLSAGVYSVTLTDAVGCAKEGTVTMTQPAPVSGQVNVVSNVHCFGTQDGVASASGSGGESPYNYSWAPYGGNLATATGLSAGIYVVTLTDYNGCTATASATLTQPASAPSIFIATQTNITCNGGTNGSATASAATGGTSPYNYAWSSGGGANLIATGLSAGAYSVTATDTLGCTSVASVTITQPVTLSISILSQTNVPCFGETGGATANAAVGGTAPYTYSWSSSGGSDLAISGLTPGSFTITATDNNGCTAFTSITITQPTQLSISMSAVDNVNCYGGTGSATANVAVGGTPPYYYSWTPSGGGNLTGTGLTAGNYTITATDNNGCIATTGTILTQPASGVSISMLTLTNPNCFGETGSATANPAIGGTGPYTYNWTSGGGTNLMASGLSAGTYTITATDNLGCNSNASVTITQPAILTASTIISFNVSCNGMSDGSAFAMTDGGTGPYTYSWSSSGGNAARATGLAAGNYLVTITDNNGCTATTSANITQPAVLTATHDSLPETSSSPCNGAAGVLLGGGTPPYTYLWTTGGQVTASISGQCAGTYCCEIIDKNGCMLTTCVTINSTTGIENISNSSSINIYPDPNTGQFTIDGIIPGQTIEVYNYAGQKISSIIADNSIMHFNISNQPGGVYLIRIMDKNGNLVSEKKIVKIQ